LKSSDYGFGDMLEPTGVDHFEAPFKLKQRVYSSQFVAA
jgi:hypothetical protein